VPGAVPGVPGVPGVTPGVGGVPSLVPGVGVPGVGVLPGAGEGITHPAVRDGNGMPVLTAVPLLALQASPRSGCSLVLSLPNSVRRTVTSSQPAPFWASCVDIRVLALLHSPARPGRGWHTAQGDRVGTFSSCRMGQGQPPGVTVPSVWAGGAWPHCLSPAGVPGAGVPGVGGIPGRWCRRWVLLCGVGLHREGEGCCGAG